MSTSPQVFVGSAPAAEGVYDLSCAVSDGRGGVVSRTAHVRVVGAGLSPKLQPGMAPASAEVVEAGKLDFVCRMPGGVTIDDLTFRFHALRGTIVANSQTGANRNAAVYTAPAYVELGDNTDVIYCVVSDKANNYGVAASSVTVTKK